MNQSTNPIPKAWFRIICAWALPRHSGLAVLLAVIPGQVFPAGTDTKQTPVDLTALPLESLMQIEVPKVYAASKVEQKVTQAPASITVITGDEVKKFGYQTLAEALQSVPGFNISYDRDYDFIGARGVNLGDYNSRILLLVDGHRVNNNLTDGALVGNAFLLDLDLVDRVEVIRGPSAVLYGNNAFFGVINVVTRTGAQLNGFEVSSGYGSFDSYRERVGYGRLFTNGVELLLSGTYFTSAGNSKLYFPAFDQRISGNPSAVNNGIAQNLDGDEHESFFGSLGYHDFSLEGAFSHREKANPTADFFTAFNDPRLKTTDEQGYAALKYVHSFKNDWDVTGRLYYDTYYHQIGYPEAFYAGNTLVYSSYSSEQDNGQWWGTELQVNKRVWDRHEFTLGAEYRDDFEQQALTTGSSAQNRDRQSHGVYFQSDIELLKPLHFDGGIRYDQYGDFTPAYDPRLALIYDPVEGSTFKAIYGTAFRAPNFNELRSNNTLKPEDITSYELDYDQQLGPHLRSSISAFYNELNKLIGYNNGAYQNFDANTRGVEAALEANWTNGVRARASYSFQHTKNYTVGWQMPDSPNHLVKVNLSAPLIPEKLFAGLEFDYTSSSYSLDTSTGTTLQGMPATGFGVVNFTLFSRNLLKNLDASASVYNLLDWHYSEPASQQQTEDLILQDGRTFRLNLTYHF